MTNERKIISFLVVVIVVAVGLAFITRVWTVTTPPPVSEPSVPVAEHPSVPPVEEEGTKIYTSSDHVTTVLARNMIDGMFTIDNPTLVTGTTTAFESQIVWMLSEASGRVIAEGSAHVASPDAGVPGPFRIWMFYDAAPATDAGTLRIYEPSAKDGSPIHEVRIPVKFLYTSGKGNGCEAKVVAAFGNSKKDPNLLDCSKTFSVSRTICGDPTSNDLLVLHELLKGPSDAEKSAGYFSSLPEHVTTPEILRTKDGKKLFDFDYTLDAGVAGSCRVGAIRAQILHTLQENDVPMSADAVIGIDGRTDDILQP